MARKRASVAMFDEPSSEPISFDNDDLETWIRDSGHYVRPGDQLRGRILDAVSMRRERRDTWRRYFGAVTFAASAVLALVVLGHVSLSVAPRGRSADDLHEQATRRAVVDGVAWEWALTEVVYDWRRAGTAKWIPRKSTPPAGRPSNQRIDALLESEL